ncbi:hypothetical protein [Siccirubricoccus sp. G192]|uniref:hypothetical protein n=1 Tax=Siccirubricoccus sp. G192 TaxID=2849651 RepID=UPI001C2BB4CD|nr:hypothetical protein [Siccirubricoccus sp. G192]MBV1795811.1 hypothetical protein [Siccirubricoccus sp. G192]
MQRVFEGRAQQSGRSVGEAGKAALGIQPAKEFVRPPDIAVFPAPGSARPASGRMLPLGGDMQPAR